jgi:pimeloyl-ACP methyl ester carboxylesterase
VEVASPYSMGEEEFNRRVFYEPERFISLQSPASRQATLDSRYRYEELMERTEHMDFSARLHEIQVPTTLIWGRHDGVIPLSIGEAFAQGIRGAELYVLERAAHAPHLEQPNEVLKLLGDLLSRLSSA